ncbi:MAG: diacylglycerol kinase family protein [Verrucomicrobiota bacterium]
MKETTGQFQLKRCFVDAARGIKAVFKTEWNFRIHLSIFLIVVVLGFVFRIEPLEWIAVLLVSGIVLVAEVLNTAIEYLADAVHPEADRGVGRAKDAAAGGVMMASIASVAVGAIVFLPKLWDWISNFN